MSKVACQGISKAFGGTRVLNGLDLEAPDGSVVAVLGSSGSGKTTLLRLIAGFDRPDNGIVLLDGEVVDSARRFVPPNRRRVGFVTQEGDLFPHLTVAKNIAFGLGRAERASGRAEEMLSLVGLDGLGGRLPHQLSGGQQQRAALARALAPRPRLMLLDEPFSSLDASLRSSLRAEVVRILRDRGATTILVTHDQSEALSVADAVGVLITGRIRQFASPETLYTHPAEPAIARFLGEANLVPGHASDGLVHTALGPLSLASGTGSLNGPALALVRPEQISLRPLAGGRGVPGLVSGRALQREYYGHDCVVLVGVDGLETQLRVRCQGGAPVEVGNAVAISPQGEVIAWPAWGDGAAKS